MWVVGRWKLFFSPFSFNCAFGQKSTSLNHSTIDVKALSMDHTVGRKRITAKAMLETMGWVYQSWRAKNKDGVAVRVLWKHQLFTLISLHFPFQFILIAPFCSRTEICTHIITFVLLYGSEIFPQIFHSTFRYVACHILLLCCRLFSQENKILETYKYVLSLS